MRVAVCYLTSSCVSEPRLLVEEEAAGEWASGGSARSSERESGDAEILTLAWLPLSPLAGPTLPSPSNRAKAPLAQRKPRLSALPPPRCRAQPPRAPRRAAVNSMGFWKVLCYQLLPGKV